MARNPVQNTPRYVASTLAPDVALPTTFLRCIPAFFRSRNKRALVEFALHQQLATYTQKGTRPSISPADRAFWVFLSQIWSGWKETLVIVQPDTVVRWHRKGFRFYWRSISKRGPGGGSAASECPYRSKCRPSFVDSSMRTAGIPERSGLNSGSLESPSASPAFLDISQSETRTTISANAGNPERIRTAQLGNREERRPRRPLQPPAGAPIRHVSWSMPGSLDGLIDPFIENLRRFRAGEELIDWVNAEEGY